MKEILGRQWDNRDYPLDVSDDLTTLMMVRDNREGSFRLFVLHPREKLDLEHLLRKMLRADFNSSGYAVRNLSTQQEMGGSNTATIYTMDHIEDHTFHTPEHAERVLNDCVVVWESCEYYFDLEE